MDKIANLQRDSEFLALLQMIEQNEQLRVFCRHGLSHLLDVARIAWIETLEQQLPLNKPVVYAAALLHDLGRAINTEAHDSAALSHCRNILLRSGFEPAEIEMILAAVAAHGDKHTPDAELASLCAVIRRADGLSRPCFACAAADECYWPDARRNHRIVT